jgi:hypothetical protein
VAEDALGDRNGVGGVALARPLVHPLPLDPPGRHVQDLVIGRGQHGADEAAVAAGILDTDRDAVRTLLREPVAQPSDAGPAIGDCECRDRRAALVDERGGVASLVDVYPDDHALSLPVEDSIGSGSVRDATVLVDWPTLL